MSKTDLDSLGEEIGDLADGFSKYAEEIKALTGFDIRVEGTTDQYKDLYDIFDGISKVWDKLSDAQQSRVSEILGGTRQLTVISSIIGNWKDAVAGYETAMNSAGAATKANDIYMETAAAHIAQFKAEFQSLSSTLVDSDVIKFFVDAGTGIMKLVESLAKAGALIPVVMALVTAISALKGTLVNAEALSALGGIGSAGFSGLFAALTPLGKVLTVVTAISVIVAALKPRIEEMTKSVDDRISETADKIKEIQNTAENSAKSYRELKKNAEDVIPRFGELAQGVDRFGQKTSKLSTEEYEEFLQLNNQVAQMFPQLVSGYDSNGNAMLNLSYSAGNLTDQLWDLVEAERAVAMANVAAQFPEMVSQVSTQVDNYKTKAEQFKDELTGVNSAIGQLADGRDIILRTETAFGKTSGITDKYLEDRLKAIGVRLKRRGVQGQERPDGGYDLYEDYIDYSSLSLQQLSKVQEILDGYVSGLEQEIQNANVQMESAWAELQPFAMSWMQTTKTFSGFDDLRQRVATELAKGLDFEAALASAPDGTDPSVAVQNYIQDHILKPLAFATPDVMKAFSDLFSMSTSDMSFKDFGVEVRELVRKISEGLGLDFAEIYKGLGFDDVISGYRKQIRELTDMFDDVDASELFAMSPDKISEAFNLAKQYGLQSFEDVRSALENETFSIKVDIDVEADGLSKVQSALNEAASATGLTSESINELKLRYQDLDGYDPAKLFENTANGVHLNTKALEELELQYNNIKKSELLKQLQDQIQEYDELTDKINEAKEAGDVLSLQNLFTQQDNLSNKIAETEQLIAQYNGLTSAYNNWLKAQSQSKERTPYESVGKSYESVGKTINETGFVGDPEVEAYLDLIYGDKNRTSSVADDYARLSEAIDGTSYSIKDFFQFTEDGAITTEGLRNYLMAVHDVMGDLGDDFVTLDKETGEPIAFNFDDESIQAVADKLGISIELMQLFHRALSEAGFDVVLDTNFANLEQVEKTAGGALKELKHLQNEGALGEGLDLNISLDVSTVEEAETELAKVDEVLSSFRDEDGHINLEVEGAAEAATVFAQLAVEKANLEGSAVLSIEVDDALAETEIGQAIQKMQDFKNAWTELDTLKKLQVEGVEISDEDIQAASAQVQQKFAAIKSDPIVLDNFNIDTKSFQTALESINSLTTEQLTESLQTALSGINEGENAVDVKLNPKGEAVESYIEKLMATPISPTVTFKPVDDGVAAIIAKYQETTITIPVSVQPTQSSAQKPSNSAKNRASRQEAQADGTAFKHGTWGAKRGGRALGGELGPELVVRNGRFFTIGDNGAEMFDYQQGDIIFSAEQTEQILKYGKILRGRRRGNAMANGTAFDSGIGGFYRPGKKDESTVVAGNNVTVNNEVNNEINVSGDLAVDDSFAALYGGTEHTASGMNGGGGGGSSGGSKAETWFDKQYKEHQHLVAMDRETDEEYLNWLEKAYQKAYKEKIIELDDFYKYEEEVYEGRKRLFEDFINDIEHKIQLEKYHKAQKRNINQIIAYYEQLMEAVHQQAEAARAMGLTDDDEYIQELQNKWWEYHNAIAEARSEWFNELLDDQKFVIERMNDLDADSVKIANSWRDVMGSIEKELKWYLDRGYDMTDEVVQDLMQELWSARDEIIEIANASVDGIQNVYKTFTDSAKEWATTGFLSVDSLQAILELGPKYLQFLYDENGQLKVNEQSLQKVLAARTEEMAAETALAYVKRILVAAEAGDIETLTALTKVATDATGATWGLVYATLGLAREIGTANGVSEDFFDNALDYIDKIHSLSITTISTIGDSYETLNDWYISQADALDKLIDYTKELLKWENQQRIQALKDQLEAYKKIIDAKKESLRLSREQDDHDKSVAEKLEEIAKLQARIDLLALDDSREARAERAKLEEELAKKQGDLADEQAKYAYDQQVDALDREYDAFEEEKNAEIEVLENLYSSEEKLFQAAIDRIQNGWGDLYQQLIAWNTEYGSHLNKEITAAWNSASDAVQRYGDFLGALIGTDSHVDLGPSTHNKDIATQLYENSVAWYTASPAEQDRLHNENAALAERWKQETGHSLSYSNGVWYSDDGAALYSLDKQQIAESIVAAMKRNAAAWHSADGITKQYLSDLNILLGQRLARLLDADVHRDGNGTWWIGNKKLFDVYHTGGIAGSAPTLKQNEVLAVLEKGEAILDKRREEGLYKVVDFIQVLSDRLGKAINPAVLNQISGQYPMLPQLSAPSVGNSVNESYVFSPTIQVAISHSGSMTEADAKRYGNSIADVALSKLKDAFTRRGVNRVGDALLKQ